MKTGLVTQFSSLLDYAIKYLPGNVYEHSVRVMQYVMCNANIPMDIHDECILVAIAHDLIEDGKIDLCDLPSLDEDVFTAIELISKDQREPYIEYIKNICSKRGTRYGAIAYWVKMADMKDHFAQKATLTDKLKAKYLEALPYLLP